MTFDEVIPFTLQRYTFSAVINSTLFAIPLSVFFIYAGMHVRHGDFHFRDKLIDLVNSKVRGDDSCRGRCNL